MITWTSLIAIYLWLAGMAGGAYFAAFLLERLGVNEDDGLLKAATWLGIPAVLVGSLLLTVELGQSLQFWHLFGEFFVLSPMSIGSWLLLLWSIVGIALLALWFAEASEPVGKPTGVFDRTAAWLRPFVPATNLLKWGAFVLSVLLIVYTGVLLSATNQPLWSKTLLLPALFVVTSISRGVAFLLLFLLISRRTSARTFALLSRSDVTLYILDLITLAAFLIALGPAREAITTGTLGVFLWSGVIFMGILVPLGIGVRSLIRGKEVGYLSLLAALWAIAGGLILRDVIVLGGQIYG